MTACRLHLAAERLSYRSDWFSAKVAELLTATADDFDCDGLADSSVYTAAFAVADAVLGERVEP